MQPEHHATDPAAFHKIISVGLCHLLSVSQLRMGLDLCAQATLVEAGLRAVVMGEAMHRAMHVATSSKET
eukprot:2527248-Amphidinium_carterae.1